MGNKISWIQSVDDESAGAIGSSGSACGEKRRAYSKSKEPNQTASATDSVFYALRANGGEARR